MERGNDLLLLVYHGGNIRQLHDDSKTASLYYIVTYELFCQIPVSGTNVKGPFGSNKWNFVQKDVSSNFDTKIPCANSYFADLKKNYQVEMMDHIFLS